MSRFRKVAVAGARTSDERALWATVNVCDTIAHPNVIGIRGSMPGADNTREQMYMRFRVQFFVQGNKAAGTRVRQAMQELKTFAQNVRTEVLAIRNPGKPE